MPRNGTGTYAAPASTWNPGVNGVTALTADYNAQLDDIEAALTQSVSSDGQTPMTGNLPMGNNKITGLAAGVANTDAVNVGQLTTYQPAAYLAQCRLTKSGANLLLSRFNGSYLTINGTPQLIPIAGVTIAPGAATPGTLYYVYAYMVTTVMTLEFVVTGHSTDPNTGIEIKTGDATRTLVGMARAIAGPLWQDIADQRFVISWFNRLPITLRAASAVLAPAPGSTPTELDVRYRAQWLHWAGQQTLFGVTASAFNNTLGQTIVTTLSLDGTTTLGQQTLSEPLANGVVNASITAPIGNSPSEGYHYVTFLASAAGGTASWTADCFTWGQVQG